MDLEGVRPQIKGDVRHMEEVVRKVLLDNVALVPERNYEIRDPVVAVELHQVPEHGAAANRHHRLRLDVGFLAQPRTEPAGQDDRLHARLLDSDLMVSTMWSR